MPYEGEFAKYESIRRITQKESVKKLLERAHSRVPSGSQPVRPQSTALTRSEWLPQLIVAIDGSHQEVPVQNGFPGAEVSYLTVACVMLDVHTMREMDAARPVDPGAFSDLQKTDAVDAVLPGVNVVLDGAGDALQSLRSEFYTLLASNGAFGVETLLETYEALMKHGQSNSTFECPNGELCELPSRRVRRGVGCYKCPCAVDFDLFSTDALRVQMGMNEAAGQNGAMYAEVSQVIEHLWLLNVLRSIEKKQWLSSLKRMAFVMDGPLAIFGHPAWLSQAIVDELNRLNSVAKEKNGEDILILGVEKSGLFMTHFEQIAIDPNREDEDYVPRKTVYLLDDAYIKKNILFADSKNSKPYGKDTYYGRKFLYKTATGALIVGVTPFYAPDHRDLSTAVELQFARIGDALNILDELVSARYPNAIIPLIAAHAEAAIPLNLGTRILETMTKDLLAKV